MAFPHFLCVCACASAWHRKHSRQMIQAFFLFLHNLISAIALPSQIQYITHCCSKGFVGGYHGYSGSQVSCAGIRSGNGIVYHNSVLCGPSGQRKNLTDTNDWQINKNTNNNQLPQPGVSSLPSHDYAQPYSRHLQRALTSLLQARLDCPVADSLDS